MYEVSNETKESIIKEMCNELDKRNYPFSESAIRKIVNTSIEAKASLIDLLSKHPNWNPEKLMIRFDEDYSRKFNTEALNVFTIWLKVAIKNVRDITVLDVNVIAFINSIKNQFFDKSMDKNIDFLNEKNENFKLRNNMKTSKAILKLCKEMGYDKLPPVRELPSSTLERPRFDDFNYEYAMLCDNINPIKVTRHTCISLNPMDYLLMSNGNGWKSCHYIDYFNDDPGCYSSGTISYMLDECSFIFYTVDASFQEKDIELTPKLQRQVFGYKDEAFVQSRLYPQSMDCGAEAIYTDIRNVVQKVISDCLEKPNLWVKTTSDVNDCVEKGYGATCYPDWESGCPGSKHCSISKIKGTTHHPTIILGKRPICIKCGCEHDIDDNITCCSSSEEYYCECCGCTIDDDDTCWVGNYRYCEDCVTYCENCGCYEVNDYAVEVHYLDRYGNNCIKWVCEDCSQDYYKCDYCEEVWDRDDVIQTEEGGCYCPDCSDKWDICGECGEYHDSDYMYYDEETDVYYCRECYDALIKERKEEKEENNYEEAI